MGNTGSSKEITTVTLQTGTARNRKQDNTTKDKTRQFIHMVMRRGVNRWETQWKQIMDNKTQDVKPNTGHRVQHVPK